MVEIDEEMREEEEDIETNNESPQNIQ